VSVDLGQLALVGLLITPGAGALLLAAIPAYRVAAPLNVALCFVTLASATLLYQHRPEATLFLLVDDLNAVFLLIGALVGFTTALFSAGYIAHELQTRRLRSRDLHWRDAHPQEFGDVHEAQELADDRRHERPARIVEHARPDEPQRPPARDDLALTRGEDVLDPLDV